MGIARSFFFSLGNHQLQQAQEEKRVSVHDLHQSTGIILDFSLMFAEKEDKPLPPHTTDRTWVRTSHNQVGNSRAKAVTAIIFSIAPCRIIGPC